MENDFQTPSKSQDGRGDGGSTIAHGFTDKKDLVESKLIQEQQNTSERAEQDGRLDQIQKQIHEIGEELRTLHYEIEKQVDKYSQSVMSKERYRNQLRKKLIDLDYEHKQIIAKRIQESRKLQEEKMQQIRTELEEREQQRRQERQERQRRRREELDKYEQQYREKLRSISQPQRKQTQQRQEQNTSEQNQQEASQPANQNSQVNLQGSQQVEEEAVEDELSRSRRRLRIAEIETELAESRLRRSRIATLSAELEHLRYSYSDPYYVYRPYVLPSYYHSYSAYPTYSRMWYY